jgi:hypothetical protein
MASPLVFLCVYATLTISLVGVSGPAAQVVETMKNHPGLLSESLNFFPRLYHTYHFRLDLSLFVLECINFRGHRHRGPGSPGSLIPSDVRCLPISPPSPSPAMPPLSPSTPPTITRGLPSITGRRPAGTRLPFELPHYTLPQARRQTRPYPCQVSPWGL